MAGGGALRRLMHLATKRFQPSKSRDEAMAPIEAAAATATKNSQVKSGALQAAFGPSSLNQDDDFSFEIDFSGLRLGVALQEMLLGLMGLPSPFPKEEQDSQLRINRSGFHVSNASLKHLYLRRELREGVETGFLVRGVIYDMSAMAMKLSAEEVSQWIRKQKKQDERDARDWSNLLHGGLDLKDSKVQDVSANDVMEKLGLQKMDGLRERVGRVPSMDAVRKKKLAEKQGLEEIIGTKDSIRAKYAERIRQKKMMSDVRREQGRFSDNQGSVPAFKLVEGVECKCLAVPGSVALVRYLQERGLVQALLARGQQDELMSLMEQLGNFKFDKVEHLASDAAPSGGMLSSICTKWGLSPKQVILVVNSDAKEAELRQVAAKGFFICKLQSQKPQQGQGEPQVSSATSTTKSQRGIKAWFTKLAEGTLHEDAHQEARNSSSTGHFSVLDMTELKWVIEDLNGVSYRPTTFVRGFQ